MPTIKKQTQVEEIKERLSRCTIAVATGYQGMSAANMTDLRARLREQEIEYRVVKNTLTYLASEAAGRPQLKGIVQGPTVLAFGYDDPQDVAKALADYIRTTRSALAIRGAVMGDGLVLPTSDVTRMANLPSKPLMLATLMGQLQSPMQRLLGVLNGPLRNLDALLQARIQQIESNESGN